MGNHEVPNDCLKRLRVGGYVSRIHRGDEDAGISHSCGESAVPPDDANDFTANLFGELQGRDEVRADLFFEIAAADGENKDGVAGTKLTDAKPVLKDADPPFVVRAGSQFGDVVGGSVSLNTGDLAEIVDGVRSIGGTATDAEDEEAAFAPTGIGEKCHSAVDNRGVEAIQDLGGFVKKLGAEAHLFGSPQVATFRIAYAVRKSSAAKICSRRIPANRRRSRLRATGALVRMQFVGSAAGTRIEGPSLSPGGSTSSQARRTSGAPASRYMEPSRIAASTPESI